MLVLVNGNFALGKYSEVQENCGVYLIGPLWEQCPWCLVPRPPLSPSGDSTESFLKSIYLSTVFSWPFTKWNPVSYTFSRGSSSPQLGLHSAPHFSAHVLSCLLPLILIDRSPTCSVPTSRSFRTHKFNMPFRFQWVISQNSIIWQVRHLTSSHSKCKTNKIKAQMLAYTIGLPELCDAITTKPLLTSESWFVK